ncbi:hypothetical protein N7G274_001699 [Stereocaulon virgatum]|uniref:Uncharacterized protein n=1 Tax=Stereocaulon virgatum TaxID=373712 RepID=A0ABR4AKE8_9LECA
MSSIPYSNLAVRYKAYKPTRIEQNEQEEQKRGKTQERSQNNSHTLSSPPSPHSPTPPPLAPTRFAPLDDPSRRPAPSAQAALFAGTRTRATIYCHA